MIMNTERIQIKLCMGSSCFTRGNEVILQIIKDFIAAHQLEEIVDFRGHLCKGKCNCGPNISINTTDYGDIKESDIMLILDKEFAPFIEKVK